MRRLCVIPECRHKATELTGFYHRANFKEYLSEGGKKEALWEENEDFV
jgi:hypothetical protein